MKFIVFEGLDGAGKSTLIALLAEELRKNRIEFRLTREPGGTPLGEELRALLLKKSENAPTPRTEVLLYQAARAQHVDCLIKPALSRGEWVISDRFSAASVAFQAGGRQITRDEIDHLNDFSTDGLKPDLYVLLDLTTEEAQRRMAGRELDRFESEKSEFHERVRRSYLGLAEENPDRWLVLDARLSKEELYKTLREFLARKGWL